MKPTIRPAKPKDWQIIQDLNHKIFSALNPNFENYFNPNWECTKPGENYFKNLVRKPESFTLIVFDNQQPIGYLSGHIRRFPYRQGIGKKVGEIENLAILPKYRKKGFGTKLFNQFKNWCQTHSIKIILLNSYVKNEAALNFYQKKGFRPIDINLELEI